jgi:hypothetical protein
LGIISRQQVRGHGHLRPSPNQCPLMVGYLAAHDRAEPSTQLRYFALQIVDIPEQREHHFRGYILGRVRITQ